MVQLNKPARDYTIRSSADGLNQKLFVSGLLSYAGGSKTIISKPYTNYAGANTTADVTFLNQTAIEPFPRVAIAPVADQTFKLILNHTDAAWMWSLNDNTPFNQSFENITPLLYDPTKLASSNLTITTKNGTWVDLIYMVSTTVSLQ